MSSSASLASVNVETQRQFVHEVWNEQNIAAIPEFIADEYVGHDPAYPKPIRGSEGYAEYVRDSIKTFPDIHIEQHAVLGDGDRVLSHYTVSGTQDGPLGPLPPTGRYVEIEGMGNIHYVDGRVVGDQAFFDTADLRRQLGLTFPAVLLTLPKLAVRAVLNRS